MFGSPSRTGLLWALEGLAWNPDTLPRVASILAKLATVEIKDNWGNKPINSLLSIFRSWMPQTAAPLDKRVAILKAMARKFPEVAWKICVTQFASLNDVGDYVHYRLKDIEPLQIQRILEAIVNSPERDGEYRLDQYYLDEAFKLLNASGALTLDQLAHLEIPYLEALKHYGGPSPGYAAPNLNRYLEAHPELYFQAVAWTYKRDDDGVEPPDLDADPELLARQAVLGHRILDAMARIPGHNDIGVLETGRLSKWIGEVLEKCRELSRGKIGEFVIGKMLSASEVGQDGVWPCEVVRDVLEEFHSENMVHGVSIGAYNARGVHWRGEGGDQERELAKKYRSWENSLRITHPFVASELLGAMAKSYERDAKSQDIDSSIRKRLR